MSATDYIRQALANGTPEEEQLANLTAVITGGADDTGGPYPYTVRSGRMFTIVRTGAGHGDVSIHKSPMRTLGDMLQCAPWEIDLFELYGRVDKTAWDAVRIALETEREKFAVCDERAS
jgi:hypothetical protein